MLPRPVPAVEGLPDWIKSMPQTMFSKLKQEEIDTVKRCPPFIDAMSYGYLMPLAIDVEFRRGRLTWDREALGDKSPIDFHENIQVVGSPLFDDDRSLLKFNNYWTIQTPPGYSVLITHPVNRYDLPFLTATGLVDSDRYCDNFVNFPARWHDASFDGVLPKGTPIAQCIPMKREIWAESVRSHGRSSCGTTDLESPMRSTTSPASIANASARDNDMAVHTLPIATKLTVSAPKLLPPVLRFRHTLPAPVLVIVGNPYHRLHRAAVRFLDVRRPGSNCHPTGRAPIRRSYAQQSQDSTRSDGRFSEALFTNHNADMRLEVDSLSLVGRTDIGRGIAHKITAEARSSLKIASSSSTWCPRP